MSQHWARVVAAKCGGCGQDHDGWPVGYILEIEDSRNIFHRYHLCPDGEWYLTNIRIPKGANVYYGPLLVATRPFGITKTKP